MKHQFIDNLYICLQSSLILVESIRFHLYFSLIFLGWRRLDSIISLESIPKLPQNLWRAVIILIMIITTVWTNKS